MTLDEKLGQLTMIRADFGDAGAELNAAKLCWGMSPRMLDLQGRK